MPKLERSEWYDITRDMNWRLRYVSEEEAWPKELSNDFGVPAEAWWGHVRWSGVRDHRVIRV
jgi:toluene monooxygenase system protein A